MNYIIHFDSLRNESRTCRTSCDCGEAFGGSQIPSPAAESIKRLSRRAESSNIYQVGLIFPAPDCREWL